MVQQHGQLQSALRAASLLSSFKHNDSPLSQINKPSPIFEDIPKTILGLSEDVSRRAANALTRRDGAMPPTKVPDKFAFDAITRAAFDALLNQYPEVLPAKIRELDEERYKAIPGAVDERRQSGDAHLTKEEAFALVSWKL